MPVRTKKFIIFFQMSEDMFYKKRSDGLLRKLSQMASILSYQIDKIQRTAV